MVRVAPFLTHSVLQGDHWSWKVMEVRKAVFQTWKVKITKVMESHGEVMKNDAVLRSAQWSTEIKAVEEQLNQKLQELKNTK